MEICNRCQLLQHCSALGLPRETVIFLMVYLSGHQEEPATAERLGRILGRRGKELEPTLDYFKEFVDRCPVAKEP